MHSLTTDKHLEGELVDLIEEFSDGRIQFAFVKVKDPNTTLPKYVLVAWCGEGVPERTKGYFTNHLAAVSKLLHVSSKHFSLRPGASADNVQGVPCTDHCALGHRPHPRIHSPKGIRCFGF